MTIDSSVAGYSIGNDVLTPDTSVQDFIPSSNSTFAPLVSVAAQQFPTQVTFSDFNDRNVSYQETHHQLQDIYSSQTPSSSEPSLSQVTQSQVASKRGRKPLAPAVVEERRLAAESFKAQKLLAKEKKQLDALAAKENKARDKAAKSNKNN